MPDIPIVVLGAGGVGKSCLTIQYIQGHFVDKYDATIEDVYRKPIDIDNQPAVLTIVDTAGQDVFGAMRDQYLKKGHGFVLVYSITDAESFQQLKKIYAQLRRVKGEQVVPCVVVGNKIDEVNYRAVSAADGQQLASQVRCPFLEVTAKNRRMAEEVFETLVRTIRGTGAKAPEPVAKVTPPPPAAPVPPTPPTPVPAPGAGLPVAAPAEAPRPAPVKPTPEPVQAPPQPEAPREPEPPVEKKKKKKSRCTLL